MTITEYKQAIAASMEPRSFEHGNVFERNPVVADSIELQWSHAHSSMETGGYYRKPRGSQQSFNGATLIRAWKHQ